MQSKGGLKPMKKIISLILVLVFALSVFTVVISAESANTGDVDSNGEITYLDYMLVKRSILGTYTMNESELARGDVSGDGRISGIDYIMIKRHCMGTYVIGGGTSDDEASAPESSDHETSTPESSTPAVTVCNHSEKEVRNASEPSSSKDGYSGDIYCKNCGEKLFTGSSYSTSTAVYGYTLNDGSTLYLPSNVDATAYTMALAVNGETSKHSTIEDEILRLINIERAKEGLAPLSLYKNGWQFAYIRAQECVGTFSHTRPDGRSWSTAYTDANITFMGAWGENIVMMGSSCTYDNEYVAQRFVELWMNSEGHRANILSDKYDCTTIGVEVKWVEEKGMYYYVGVQNFFGDYNY